MSRSSSGYSLGKSTALCAATGRALVPGEPIMAALCDAPETPQTNEFVRHDFALEAWTNGARPKDMVCFWRTTAPEPDQRRRLLVDDDTLLELFERMADDDRPQRVAYRWLLCLILLRKKLLRHVRVDREGDREWWIVRPRGAADDLPPMRVANPKIRDEDLQELAEHLGEVMQSEL